MEQNTQLKERISQMYESFATGDPSVVDTVLSAEKEVLGIGTDPGEWWVGDDIRRAFKAQLQEMHAAGIRFRERNIQAFSEGSVGWASDQTALTLDDGAEVPMRLTTVWRQEAGDWRMVQFHLSIGVPNQDALGEELTT